MEEGEHKDSSICPSPDQLEYSGPVHCPVEGCGKELPSTACLRMHITRRHLGKQLERTHGGRSVHFYCPVSGCSRGKTGGEPFSRLGQLKQHYQTMHGDKNYTCSECGKKFALRDVYNRHQQECQQEIVCTTCGLEFRSRNALYQHAKRKGHTLPSGKKEKHNRTKTVEGSSPAMKVVLLPIPTTVKLVVPVPRVGKVVSVATQTVEEATHTNQVSSIPKSPPLLRGVELQSSSSQTILLPLSFNHTHLLRSPSELLSLGTQTNFPPPLQNNSTLPLTTESITQSCQTQPTQLCDFGTQTQVITTNHTDFIDTATQCIPTPAPSTTSTCSSTGMYDNEGCRPLTLVEFGTQTTVSHSHSTYHHHHQHHHTISNDSDMVDFGTQTIGMTDYVLDDDDSLFSSHLLPPECLDFGTQTLDLSPSSYDCMSHTSCLHSSSTTDTRDQSSQT